MTKKIIALMAVATIIFVCTFAACGKDDENNVYVDNKEYNFVTDENGDKVLSKDGELVVYATDDNGKYIKNSDGEYETLLQQFQPIEDDGVVEDYGYIFTLPEGWETDKTQVGSFVNKKNNGTATIDIVKYLYDDYYKLNLDTYEKLKKELGEDAVTWEEDVDILPEAEKACRFTMKAEDAISVLVFFENSGNIYKILYTTTNVDTAVYECDIFCKAITFKGFQYYNDITAVSDKNK